MAMGKNQTACVLPMRSGSTGERQSQGRMLPNAAGFPSIVMPVRVSTIGWKCSELPFQQTCAKPALYPDYAVCAHPLPGREAVAITPAGLGSVKRLPSALVSNSGRYCHAVGAGRLPSCGNQQVMAVQRNGFTQRRG